MDREAVRGAGLGRGGAGPGGGGALLPAVCGGPAGGPDPPEPALLLQAGQKAGPRGAPGGPGHVPRQVPQGAHLRHEHLRVRLW